MIMPAKPIRNRLIPYKILGYLLFSPAEDLSWLESISDSELRVTTGEGSRALRMKITAFREALFWLEDFGLVESVKSERKRGHLIVKLKQPANIKVGN